MLLLHRVGGGCPDTLVGAPRPCPRCSFEMPYNYLVEIKDGEQTASNKKLTTDEKKFFEEWRGHVEVASSIEEALRIVGR